MASTVFAIASNHPGARGGFARQRPAERRQATKPLAAFDSTACDRDLHSYFVDSVTELDCSAYLQGDRPSTIRRIEQWLTPKFVDARALELGCGTGFWTQTLAKVARGVVAVDRVQPALDMAAERVPGRPVRFVHDDIYDIVGTEGRFNAAFAGFLFSHIPKSRRPEFFAALSRVLVPGAEVVLIDDLRVEAATSRIVDIDADGNTYETRRTQNGVNHRVLKNYPSEAELMLAAAKHGVRAKYLEWDYYWTLAFAAA